MYPNTGKWQGYVIGQNPDEFAKKFNLKIPIQTMKRQFETFVLVWRTDQKLPHASSNLHESWMYRPGTLKQAFGTDC